MARRVEHNPINDAVEILAEQGLEGLGEIIAQIINQAMLIERERHLGVGPYERGEARQGHANGFKPKTVDTRAGRLELAVPQVRDSSFYPSALERGVRSERALKCALAEMYIQGVSTRKVAEVTGQLCGFEVTSTQVSRATAALDEQLQAWRERELGAFPIVYLDARYEKIREGGTVVDAAVLVAVGIRADGHRQVLGCSTALSEQETHWRGFLESLVERGLHGVELVVSDAHSGLRAALKAVLPSVPWQRCQFHLQQNAQSYVPRKDQRREVARAIRAIFDAPNRTEAERLLKMTVEAYQSSAPRLARWMADNLPEGLTVFDYPESQRKRLRTTNMLERINKEIRRRTRVATLFPNPESCLRLVSAVLMEISEEWETGRVYIRMS